MTKGEYMKTFIRVVKSLSDPNRVKILKMLEVKELCVCEITALLGLAQSTVSKHLRILEEAGFIDSWKEGSWVNYKIAGSFENQYAEIMQGNLKDWLNDSPEIAEILSRVADVDRQIICAA